MYYLNILNYFQNIHPDAFPNTKINIFTLNFIRTFKQNIKKWLWMV